MAITAEVQNKIAQWRAKAIDGTLTIDECAAAVALLRGDRRAAADASEASRRTKARKVVKSADEMLGELEGL